MGWRGHFKAAAREIKHGLRLGDGKAIIKSDDLSQTQTVFKVLKNNRNRNPSAPKHPSSANLAGHTLHGVALAPIERHRTKSRNRER